MCSSNLGYYVIFIAIYRGWRRASLLRNASRLVRYLQHTPTVKSILSTNHIYDVIESGPGESEEYIICILFIKYLLNVSAASGRAKWVVYLVKTVISLLRRRWRVYVVAIYRDRSLDRLWRSLRMAEERGWMCVLTSG